MKEASPFASEHNHIRFWRSMTALACGLFGPVGFGQTTPAASDIIYISNSSELTNAINNATGGEMILLESGDYGVMSLTNRNMPAEVTIMAALNAIPEFTSVVLTDCSAWRISGFHVKPRFTSGADTNDAVRLIGSDIIFENSEINYAENTSDWSATDWLNRTGNGIVMGGTRITVQGNSIQFVDHAIASDATHSLIARNEIDHFRGDACRSLGNYVTFEYNLGKNAVKVDDNHDDFFQSWSSSIGGVGTGEVVGVVVRGNTFISYKDKNLPFATIPQGIGLFDGMFREWVIENNVIITGHWHGISILGAIDCRIVNNTVLDRDDRDGPSPWVQINDHKNGTSSDNSVIRNNLAHDIIAGTGVTADHNLIVDDPALYYVDPASHDLHLLEDSPAVDTGSSTLAADIDRDGIERPQGESVDVGAYERVVGITDTDGDRLPDEWETTHIGHLEEGPLDDGDGDGHANLFELAVGSDPSFADSEKFVNAFVEQVGNHRFLTIYYRRSRSIYHLSLTVEFSENMVAWVTESEDNSMINLPGALKDNGDGTDWVLLRYPIPLSNLDKIFARINVH